MAAIPQLLNIRYPNPTTDVVNIISDKKVSGDSGKVVKIATDTTIRACLTRQLKIPI